MFWRRPILRWAVIFVAPGLAWWLFLSPSRTASSLAHPIDAPARPVGAAVQQPLPAPGDVIVISIDEYSGHLLAAALPPMTDAPAPLVSDGIVFLSGIGPAPEPEDHLLVLRSLRTQFRTYRGWALPAAATPLAVGLTEPLSDVRDVWRGEEALGPLDIVQNDNRLLRGDIVVTAVSADGAITIDYGGTSYTLAPGTAWRFAAVRPPDGDADDIAWLDEAAAADPTELTALDEWLGEHLAKGYTDTVLTVTNHGLIAREHIHAGTMFDSIGWPSAPVGRDMPEQPTVQGLPDPDAVNEWWQP